MITEALLRTQAWRYPPPLIEGQLRDIPRIASNIGFALRRHAGADPRNLSLMDLGGGVGLFSIGCAALGMRRVVLVDDFNDEVNQATGSTILDLHRSMGIEVHSRDVVTCGIGDIAGTFDIITSFDSMEHWHHSPRALFAQVVARLKPGGTFLLGVPNCANLRKRLTLLFGRGQWSTMRDWYEVPVFRGHVREPDVADLHYICRDMGLVRSEIIGRNWLGHLSSRRWVRLGAALFDHPLRLRPQLCSDIYLLAQKPTG
ncbi:MULTISPECIES: class I SAM-dependent methyltransferase [Aphanothece]|uniref:class I SAM-dependent methyltransferase n=1 Tax=Aphanothece TaxID=1121 RepID=UPI00398531C3